MGNIDVGTREHKQFVEYKEAVQAALEMAAGGVKMITIVLHATDYEELFGELGGLSLNLVSAGTLAESFAKTTRLMLDRPVSTS